MKQAAMSSPGPLVDQIAAEQRALMMLARVIYRLPTPVYRHLIASDPILRAWWHGKDYPKLPCAPSTRRLKALRDERGPPT